MEVFLFLSSLQFGEELLPPNQTGLIYARNTMPEAKGLHVFSCAFHQAFEEHLPKNWKRLLR